MIQQQVSLPNSAISMDAWLHPIICSLVSTQRNGTARLGFPTVLLPAWAPTNW